MKLLVNKSDRTAVQSVSQKALPEIKYHEVTDMFKKAITLYYSTDLRNTCIKNSGLCIMTEIFGT